MESSDSEESLSDGDKAIYAFNKMIYFTCNVDYIGILEARCDCRERLQNSWLDLEEFYDLCSEEYGELFIDCIKDWRGDNGLTYLGLLCRGSVDTNKSKVSLIRKIVNLLPKALTMRYDMGDPIGDTINNKPYERSQWMNPLCEAICNDASIETIQYLIDADKSKDKRSVTHDENVNLHEAVRRVRSDGNKVVRLLLDVDPTLLWARDHKGRIPLNYSSSSKISKFLLKEMYNSLRGEDGSYNILRALLLLYDDLPRKSDNTTMKCADFKEMLQDLLDGDDDLSLFTTADQMGQYPIHTFLSYVPSKTKEDRRDIVKYLTERDPESIRKMDADGNLPLHLAIKNIRPWVKGGTSEIFMSYKEAGRIQDPSTKLYPFMIAAEQSSCLTTTYELLRNFPDLIHMATATKSSPSSPAFPKKSTCNSAKCSQEKENKNESCINKMNRRKRLKVHN